MEMGALGFSTCQNKEVDEEGQGLLHTSYDKLGAWPFAYFFYHLIFMPSYVVDMWKDCKDTHNSLPSLYGRWVQLHTRLNLADCIIYLGKWNVGKWDGSTGVKRVCVLGLLGILLPCEKGQASLRNKWRSVPVTSNSQTWMRSPWTSQHAANLSTDLTHTHASPAGIS